MSLEQLTQEEISEMSLIEIAYFILEKEGKAMNFYEITQKVADAKGVSKEELDDRLAQFYTDINIDGRYLCVGNNLWGLRSWYPFDQIDDDISQTTPKKKTKKKKTDDFDDIDELEEDEYLVDEDDYIEEDEEDEEDDFDDIDTDTDEEDEEDTDFDDVFDEADEAADDLEDDLESEYDDEDEEEDIDFSEEDE